MWIKETYFYQYKQSFEDEYSSKVRVQLCNYNLLSLFVVSVYFLTFSKYN